MLAALLAWALAAPTVEPLFAPANLVAWCIVPFDAKNRTPEQRAEMLAKLGFQQFAYDWRSEHLPTFDRELTALKKHNVKLSAIWFPGGLTKDNRYLLDVMEKHNIQTQLWLMLVDFPAKDQAGKVAQAVEFVRPIAEEAAKRGHTVALYNHGGWGGEPENQIEIIAALGRKNVGIVYNLHHGHEHLSRFEKLLTLMKPHLLTLNLNGMVPGGDKAGQKIVPIGHGSDDARLLKIIRQSGYSGPIGILGHTSEDAEARLADNLAGLRWLISQTADQPATAKPAPHTSTGMPYRLQRTAGSKLGFEFQALHPDWQLKLKTLSEDALERALRIYRVDSQFDETKLDTLQPLLGQLTRNNSSITFQAPFAPLEGQTYRVYVDLSLITGNKVSSLVVRELSIPKVKRMPTAKVVQVYPTAKELPENTLRMYFEFSQPMSRDNAYRNIQLLDEKEQPVKYPFLEIEQELWSPDGTRFTLFFDPGRVKRGLVPREELGPPLEEGKIYTLVISANWKDQNGTPMIEGFRKKFQVTAPVERGLNLKNDFVPGAVPKSGTQDAYTIRFAKQPLDSALAERLIWVVNAKGQRIAGKVTLGAAERSWHFVPDGPWQAGEYRIQIDTALEDICGNRIGEAFEIDVLKQQDQKPPPKIVGWSFTPR